MDKTIKILLLIIAVLLILNFFKGHTPTPVSASEDIVKVDIVKIGGKSVGYEEAINVICTEKK